MNPTLLPLIYRLKGVLPMPTGLGATTDYRGGRGNGYDFRTADARPGGYGDGSVHGNGVGKQGSSLSTKYTWWGDGENYGCGRGSGVEHYEDGDYD